MGVYRNDDSLIDGNIVHTDVPQEFTTIPEKTNPAADDLLILESTSEGSVKRRVQVGNLPGGSGGGGGGGGSPVWGHISVLQQAFNGGKLLEFVNYNSNVVGASVSYSDHTITVSQAGIYKFEINLSKTFGTAPQDFSMELRVNGSNYYGTQNIQGMHGENSPVRFNFIADLQANDAVSFFGNQSVSTLWAQILVGVVFYKVA